jgi:ethanolamine utilization protein EutA
MNVDIGGGTSKIAVCKDGEVVDITVIDVGARVICFDGQGRVTRIEEAGKYFAAEAGVVINAGDTPASAVLHSIVDVMADKLFQAMGASPLETSTRTLLRLDPLQDKRAPDVITFSGGVSEYIYGRENKSYGDLGPLLALAVQDRLTTWGPRLETGTANIRATVVGASQYTVQVSGNTIFVQPLEALPLRNIPVITPELPLEAEQLDPGAIANAISKVLQHLDPRQIKNTVAVYYRWAGSATYLRLDAFCRGVIAGLTPVLARGMPLVLVSDGDLGGLIGLHCFEECRPQNPIISIDGIVLNTFDFIDIGALLDASGAVPVVIKSLVFPASATLGRATQ